MLSHKVTALDAPSMSGWIGRGDSSTGVTNRLLRTVGQVTVVWTTVGLFRSVVHSSFDAPGGGPVSRSMVRLVLITWFWVPVSLAALAAWRAKWPAWSPRQRATAVVGALAGVVVLQPLWMVAVARVLGLHRAPYVATLAYCLDVNCLFFVACLAFLWGASALRASEEAARATADLQLDVAETELHVATMQLQPHFLFNALHLMSELALESPARAERLVRQLRGLLWQSFRHTPGGVVPLRRELAILRSYLRIQRERFTTRLEVTIDVPADAMEIGVPHLLLQPLAENAIRHGVGRRAGAGRVWIRARRDAARMIIEVEDDGVGLEVGDAYLRDGVGIAVTRRRLQLVFGEDASLSLHARDGGGTVARVVFPARAVSRGAPIAAGTQRVEAEPKAFNRPGFVERWVSFADANRKSARLIAIAGLAVMWVLISTGWTAAELLGDRSLHLSASAWPTFSRFAAVATGWVFVIPLGACLARFVRIRTSTFRAAVLGHAAAAATVTAVQFGVTTALAAAFTIPDGAKILTFAGTWAVWNVATYITLVIASRSLRLALAAHARGVAAARLDAEAAAAHARLKQLQLQPGVMMAALGHAGAIVRAGGEEAEDAITRLGDLLRGISRGGSVNAEAWHLSDELATVRAYADLFEASREHRSLAVEIVVSQRSLGRQIPAGLLTPVIVALAREPETSARTGACVIRARTHEGDGLLVRVAVDTDDAADTARRVAPTLRGLEDLLALQNGRRDEMRVMIERAQLTIRFRLSPREIDAWHSPIAERARSTDAPSSVFAS